MTRAAAYTIETFSRKRPLRRRLYYFRIVEANGQPVAQSEGYWNRADRDTTAAHLRTNLIEAEIVDA